MYQVLFTFRSGVAQRGSLLGFFHSLKREKKKKIKASKKCNFGDLKVASYSEKDHIFNCLLLFALCGSHEGVVELTLKDKKHL